VPHGVPESGVVKDVSSPAPGTRVRIVGIDPGSLRTGVGFVDVGRDGRAQHVFHTTLDISREANFALRLKRIFDGLSELIQVYQPQEAAIERVFMARNADSALKLGQARGAALCAVTSDTIAVFEYAPTEVKRAVVGGGGAQKKQVQHMVGMLLGVEGPIQADAADALAVAITHAHTRTAASRLGIVRSNWRTRR